MLMLSAPKQFVPATIHRNQHPIQLNFDLLHSIANPMLGSLLKQLFGRLLPVADTPTTPLNEAGILQAANAAIGRDDLSAAADGLALLVSSGSQNPDVYVAYGYVLLTLKEYSKAKKVLQSAVALAPGSADAYYMLGKVCMALNEPDVAEQAWSSCYMLSHEIEALYCDFCLLLFSKGKMDQAKKLMQSGAKNYPANATIHFFHGNLHSELGDYESAAVAYQQSMAIDPTSGHLLSNYGNALRYTGNLTLSIELTKRAVHMAPESALLLSNYLLSVQYSTLFSKAEKFAAHREYAQKFETPVLSHWGKYKNSIAPGRKIRIGYVSGDFRSHSMIFFILPILANHDKSKFEVYGYYTYPLPDTETLQAKNLCDKWVTCHNMSDDELEACIRADEVDILIDLSGHTGYNRLLVFARKPAPIQMTWLGYQSTTGLSAIDYRITEEALDPTGGSEAFHSEKLLRLPSSGTFSPLPDSPTVNELPSLSGSAFTFACLNNPAKITDEAIGLWSQILTASPASCMMIGNATPALIDKISTQLALHNVDASRVVFQSKVGIKEYLQLHRQIDLVLDTFPYNGGTTTFHSLWMGVPVIALEGDTALSKVGATIMHGLGLGQFCCASTQNYVDTAVYFANHLSELNAVRLSLREQMAVLMRWLAQHVTVSLENAFEDCWNQYRQEALQNLQSDNAEWRVSK
jgi:protein O-GlcNAc transferase